MHLPGDRDQQREGGDGGEARVADGRVRPARRQIGTTGQSEKNGQKMEPHKNTFCLKGEFFCNIFKVHLDNFFTFTTI